MSKKFSLALWVLKLPRASSCIHSNRRKQYYVWEDYQNLRGQQVDQGPLYYALAEDWQGEHCPYPMLPRWAQRLFRWRLGIQLWLTRGFPERRIGFLKIKVPTRGWNWHFRCPECKAMSFYTFRNHRCFSCGCYFNEDLVCVNRLYSQPASGRLSNVYMGGGQWVYRQPSRADDYELDDLPF